VSVPGAVAPRPDPAPSPQVPPWFTPLHRVLRTATADQLSRFSPPPGHHRRSAVLMLFGADGAASVDVLLTERSANLRSHAGQVAFPGGRLDPTDAGPEAAALREAQEETGLDPAGVTVAVALRASVLQAMVTLLSAWR